MFCAKQLCSIGHCLWTIMVTNLTIEKGFDFFRKQKLNHVLTRSYKHFLQFIFFPVLYYKESRCNVYRQERQIRDIWRTQFHRAAYTQNGVAITTMITRIILIASKSTIFRMQQLWLLSCLVLLIPTTSLENCLSNNLLYVEYRSFEQ